MKVMSTLKPGWEMDSLKADTQALHGMSLRLRFNSDMFQKVCLVRSESEITAEELGMYIDMKYREQILTEFLEESSLTNY